MDRSMKGNLMFTRISIEAACLYQRCKDKLDNRKALRMRWKQIRMETQISNSSTTKYTDVRMNCLQSTLKFCHIKFMISSEACKSSGLHTDMEHSSSVIRYHGLIGDDNGDPDHVIMG